MTTLIGTNPDQIPINSMLGGMAYQDPESINVKDFNSSGTASISNLSYSGTMTGGTDVINIGSNQIYKDASGNVGLGAVPISNGKTLNLVNTTTNPSSFYLQNSTTGFTTTDGTLLQLDGLSTYLWNFENSTLSLATNNTEYVKLTSTGDLLNLGTGALKLQEGTTAQRPASPQEGMIRKNSTLTSIEAFVNNDWTQVLNSNNNSFENRNLIINGDFLMTSYSSERYAFNNSVGLLVDNTNFYIPTANRWYFQASVANALSYNTSGLTAVNMVPQDGIISSLSISNSTGGVTSSDWTLGQRFENGYLDRLLGSETLTLSFWIKNTSGAPTSISYEVRNPNSINSWSSTSFTASSTSTTSGSVSVSTSWVKKQITFTNTSGNDRGLQVTFSGTGHLNGTVYITGVQLERGLVATAFEKIPEPVLLDRCKRYRQYFPFATGVATGGGVVVPLTLQIPMRALPTVTCPNYTYSDGSAGSTIIPASATIPQGGPSALYINLSGGGMAATAGKCIMLYGTSPGNGIVLSSEI